MIELRHIRFAYNGREIFHDLSLLIDKGSFAVLAGETGSGKTTLTQMLIGEQQPDRGEILVGNRRIDTLTKSELARYRQSVGFVFEEIALLEERTVEENVALPLEIAGTYRKHAIREQVERQLEAAHLSDRAILLPRELSLGERQRAAIARALVTEPLVLVADCPASQLDAASSREILAILAAQNIRGMTVLLTMPEITNRDIFPRTTAYYRLHNGAIHSEAGTVNSGRSLEAHDFLPETVE